MSFASPFSFPFLPLIYFLTPPSSHLCLPLSCLLTHLLLFSPYTFLPLFVSALHHLFQILLYISFRKGNNVQPSSKKGIVTWTIHNCFCINSELLIRFLTCLNLLSDSYIADYLVLSELLLSLFLFLWSSWIFLPHSSRLSQIQTIVKMKTIRKSSIRYIHCDSLCMYLVTMLG